MIVEIRPAVSGMVNAYLVRTDDGCVLIDTGFRNQRVRLERLLEDEGCGPADLKLILITHGDPDHAANAAHLRRRFGSKIGMHREEQDAVERGDMSLSRGTPSIARRILRPLMALFRLRKEDRFTPDVFFDDGDRLEGYGLDATVLHVPGHTRGSIGVLTADGAFFSGDFLENRTRPSIARLVDDPEALRASYERIRERGITKVYPGHGAPFSIGDLQDDP
jgi:hydroxyacylglutathione hydrolase